MLCQRSGQRFVAAAQVVQAAAAAVWGCATSSRTRHLLTEIGAVGALLVMLQKTLAMEAALDSGLAPSGQAPISPNSERDQLQVLFNCFGASSYMSWYALYKAVGWCECGWYWLSSILCPLGLCNLIVVEW